MRLLAIFIFSITLSVNAFEFDRHGMIVKRIEKDGSISTEVGFHCTKRVNGICKSVIQVKKFNGEWDDYGNDLEISIDKLKRYKRVVKKVIRKQSRHNNLKTKYGKYTRTLWPATVVVLPFTLMLDVIGGVIDSPSHYKEIKSHLKEKKIGKQILKSLISGKKEEVTVDPYRHWRIRRLIDELEYSIHYLQLDEEF